MKRWTRQHATNMRGQLTPRLVVRRRRGAILVAALALLLVVTLVTGVIVQRSLIGYRQLRADERQIQALLLVDAGEELALRRLAEAPDYRGEVWKPRPGGGTAAGSVTIRVERLPGDPERRQIVIEATYPEDAATRASFRRQRPLANTPVSNLP